MTSLPAGARARPVRVGRWTSIPHGVDPAHPMPMEHGGAARNGRLRTPIPERAPRLLWQRDPAPQRDSAARPREPIVAADGTIYVGLASGVTAWTADGTLRWEASIGPVDGSPAILPGGDLVAVTRAGRVAVIAPDGRVRSDADLGGVHVGVAPLVLDDGSIVIAGGDRTLTRLEASLRPRFSIALDGGIAHAPTRDGDRMALVVASEVQIVDFEGRLERRIPLGARGVTSAARADDGTLWVPVHDGHLLAITGRRRIAVRAAVGSGGLDDEAPAIAFDGSVRVAARGAGLACFSPRGELRWTRAVGAAIDFPVRVDPLGRTLAIARPQALWAFDESGEPMWQVPLPGAPTSGPATLPDGSIVVLGPRGRVSVLGSA
jgi:outer membrane protein assembly factor BamB